MNYRFGIIVHKWVNKGRKKVAIGVCSCGQHMISNVWHTSKFECNKCGNRFFVNASNQSRERFSIPYLEALRKDNRGFKVKRVNLSVEYKDGEVKVVKHNLTRTIEYDIVDKVLKVWREDELEYDHGVNGNYRRDETQTRFFTQLDEDLFLDFVSNDTTRDLYKVVGDLSHTSYDRKDNVFKGLISLMMSYPHLQILASAGVPQVNRFAPYFYGRPRTDNVLDSTKTKPHEILKVPKFMMAYIREDLSIDRNVLNELQAYFKTVDNNKFREIMSIVKDEGTVKDLSNCVENLMQIHIDYEYTNLKKLVLYIFREVRMTQGIDSPASATTYLRDYIRMSRQLGQEYEKYPKSLKKEHDVVQMNYNVVFAGEETQKLFKMAVEKSSYQKLAFQNKKEKFAIVLPETSKDLIREGSHLSHCVASYVTDVNDDRCKILFLRDKDEIEKPLATIEVRGLNIRQAKGYSNSAVTEEQKEFIKLWADENNLVENYY